MTESDRAERERVWHVEVMPAAPGVPAGASEDPPHVLCDEYTGEVSMTSSSWIARVDTHATILQTDRSSRRPAGPASSESVGATTPGMKGGAGGETWTPMKPTLWPVKGMTAANDVHFSPDCRYISIVTTRNDFDVVHTPSLSVMHISRERLAQSLTPATVAGITADGVLPAAAASVAVPANALPMIVGCVWPFPDTLAVVATDAIELYVVKCLAGKVRTYLVRVLRGTPQWFRYVRERNLLLVCTGAAVMSVLRFGQRASTAPAAVIARMPTLRLVRTLDVAPPAPPLDVVPSWQAGLVVLYGEPFVAQVVATRSADSSLQRAATSSAAAAASSAAAAASGAKSKASAPSDDGVEIVLWPVGDTRHACAEPALLSASTSTPAAAPLVASPPAMRRQASGNSSSSSSSSTSVNTSSGGSGGSGPLAGVPAEARGGLVRLPTPFGAASIGDVRFQVVDNLLLVHSFTQRASLVYDIRLPEFPALPLPMVVSPRAPTPPFADGATPAPVLYSAQAAFAGTSFVVDTRDGALWRVGVHTESIMRELNNKVTLVLFLLRRADGRPYILRVLRDMIADTRPLRQIGAVFERINVVLASHLRREASSTSSSTSSTSNNSSSSGRRSSEVTRHSMSTTTTTSSAAATTTTTPSSSLNADGFVVVTQEDMFEHVFSAIDEKDVPAKYLVAVLTEYIRTLNYSQIGVEPFMYSKLIEVLVKAGRFQQLYQFLQYHIIGDSVPVACQLLSLEAQYPPAYQMALDMLKRLGEHAHILEVLLVKRQLVPALRLVRTARPPLSFDPTAFLDAALESGDRSLFYTVYAHFRTRGMLPKNYPVQEAERYLDASAD